MRPQDLPDYLRRLKQELPRQVAQEQADKMQGVLDRVLAGADGKDVEAVKLELAARWRAELGDELEEPMLSEYAGYLAAGQCIKVNMRLTIQP